MVKQKIISSTVNVAEIDNLDVNHLNNGAHYQFIKDVSTRIATETALVATCRLSAELASMGLMRSAVRIVLTNPRKVLMNPRRLFNGAEKSSHEARKRKTLY